MAEFELRVAWFGCDGSTMKCPLESKYHGGGLAALKRGSLLSTQRLARTASWTLARCTGSAMASDLFRIGARQFSSQSCFDCKGLLFPRCHSEKGALTRSIRGGYTKYQPTNKSAVAWRRFMFLMFNDAPQLHQRALPQHFRFLARQPRAGMTAREVRRLEPIMDQRARGGCLCSLEKLERLVHGGVVVQPG